MNLHTSSFPVPQMHKLFHIDLRCGFLGVYYLWVLFLVFSYSSLFSLVIQFFSCPSHSYLFLILPPRCLQSPHHPRPFKILSLCFMPLTVRALLAVLCSELLLPHQLFGCSFCNNLVFFTFEFRLCLCSQVHSQTA